MSVWFVLPASWFMNQVSIRSAHQSCSDARACSQVESAAVPAYLVAVASGGEYLPGCGFLVLAQLLAHMRIIPDPPPGVNPLPVPLRKFSPPDRQRGQPDVPFFWENACPCGQRLIP